MKKYSYLSIISLCLVSVAFAADSQIWGDMMIQNIEGYGKEGTLKLGELFVMLQANYFSQIFF